MKFSRNNRQLLLAIVVCLQWQNSFADDSADREIITSMRSLDDQVQEIKSDVLNIASELALLEEQILYPSNTHLAIFVALEPTSDMRLDAVHLSLNGDQATHHIYSFKELDALQSGGVQRLYTGNIQRGDHALDVELVGKSAAGDTFTRSHKFSFEKGISPSMLGLTLGGEDGANATLADW